MRYFYDTEFRTDDKYLEPISIGMVDENDKEFYAVFNSNEFDFDLAWQDEWLKENVLISIYEEHEGTRDDASYENVRGVFDVYGQSKEEIKQGIIAYVGDETPEFYDYYGAHDWTIFCFIFSGMLELPENYPMFSMDLKQMMESLELTKEWKQEVCPDPEGEHNALIDAKWNKDLFDCIIEEIVE